MGHSARSNAWAAPGACANGVACPPMTHSAGPPAGRRRRSERRRRPPPHGQPPRPPLRRRRRPRRPPRRGRGEGTGGKGDAAAPSARSGGTGDRKAVVACARGHQGVDVPPLAQGPFDGPRHAQDLERGRPSRSDSSFIWTAPTPNSAARRSSRWTGVGRVAGKTAVERRGAVVRSRHSVRSGPTRARRRPGTSTAAARRPPSMPSSPTPGVGRPSSPPRA
jgi:hypothetical protein